MASMIMVQHTESRGRCQHDYGAHEFSHNFGHCNPPTVKADSMTNAISALRLNNSIATLKNSANIQTPKLSHVELGR
jgi:hypothetical protein